ELYPGPALLLLEDAHRLAGESLRVERRIRPRLAPERRARRDDAPLPRLDIARGRHRAREEIGGEVRPGRSDARIRQRHSRSPYRGSTLPWATMRSPSRSTASAPFTVRCITTLR